MTMMFSGHDERIVVEAAQAIAAAEEVEASARTPVRSTEVGL